MRCSQGCSGVAFTVNQSIIKVLRKKKKFLVCACAEGETRYRHCNIALLKYNHLPVSHVHVEFLTNTCVRRVHTVSITPEPFPGEPAHRRCSRHAIIVTVNKVGRRDN